MELPYERPQSASYSASERTTQQQHIDMGPTNGFVNGVPVDRLVGQLAKGITENELAMGLPDDGLRRLGNGLANGLTNDLTNGTRAPQNSISSSNGESGETVTPGTSISSTTSSTIQFMEAIHSMDCKAGQCAKDCRSLFTIQTELKDVKLPRFYDRIQTGGNAGVEI